MSVACLDSSASPVTEIESVAEATADATEIVETTVAVQIEVDHPAAMVPPLPSVHDFSCPICLELLPPPSPRALVRPPFLSRLLAPCVAEPRSARHGLLHEVCGLPVPLRGEASRARGGPGSCERVGITLR